MRYEPDYELVGRLVEMLRADQPMYDILFHEHAPVHEFDRRIYSAYAELPTDPPLRSQLPRVLIEAAKEAVQYEQQDPEQPLGGVTIWMHSLAPVSNSQVAEQLDSRARYVFASTPLSTPRIIASGLVEIGQRRRTRETAFPAWRITSQFRAHLVGVL